MKLAPPLSERKAIYNIGPYRGDKYRYAVGLRMRARRYLSRILSDYILLAKAHLLFREDTGK